MIFFKNISFIVLAACIIWFSQELESKPRCVEWVEGTNERERRHFLPLHSPWMLNPPYLCSQRLSLPPLVCSTCPFLRSPFPSASTYTLLPLLATCGLVKHPAHCVVGKWPPPHTCRPVEWPRRELATGQLNKHFWGLASRRSISGQEGLLSAAACWDLGVLQPHLQDSLSGLLGGGRGGSDYSPACPPGLASWVRKGKEARLHGFQGDLAWESSRCRKPWKWLPFSIPRIQALCFHSDQEEYVFPQVL